MLHIVFTSPNSPLEINNEKKSISSRTRSNFVTSQTAVFLSLEIKLSNENAINLDSSAKYNVFRFDVVDLDTRVFFALFSRYLKDVT